MRPAVGGLFSFPLKIHFKGRQLPAERGFFKFSFALVIRKTGFWQPAGQKNFSLTYYYNLNRSKWPGTETDNKKSSKSFSDLLLSLAAGGRLVFGFLVGYQSCNLGFLNHTFLS